MRSPTVRPSRVLSAAWGMVLGTGCAGGSDVAVGNAPAGASVLPVDSVRLEATDRFYLGNPLTLVVDTLDGTFLVSDFFEDRVIRFARDGHVVQAYGRPGPGPGEFLDLGAAFVLGDSVVVGTDDRRDVFQLFSRKDGAYVGAYRYSGTIGFGGVSVTAHGVVFASRDVAKRTIAAVWSYPDAAIEYVVPLPAPYVRSVTRQDGGTGRFAAFHATGSVVAWADTLLVGMSGLNEAYLATTDGSVLDTLHVPAVRRRGVPEDIQERMDDWDFKSAGFELGSSLSGFYRLSGGETVVVHHDEMLEGVQPTGTISGDIYLSVVAPDRKTACVDGLAPHWKEMRAVHTVARDTLFLLDRRLNASEDGLETMVRAYRIDTSDCAWLPMQQQPL